MLIKHDEKGELDSIFILKVDDRLGIGTKGFLREEEYAVQLFAAKPRITFAENPLNFNGSNINISREGWITMDI